MKNHMSALGLVGTVVAGIGAIELASPGFTITAALGIAKVATELVLASVWPLAAFGYGWLVFQAGQHVGHRDAIQEVATATARKRRLLPFRRPSHLPDPERAVQN